MSLPRVSEAEFLELPVTHDRVELLDGEVIMAASPTRQHQDVVLRLARVLGAWADAHRPAYVGLAPLDVRIAAGRIVQPDLFVVLAGVGSEERPLSVVPDLVVEVLSERRSYDRLAKRVVYAEASVREYWLVDPDDRAVEVVEGLRTVRVERVRLESAVLPGLSADVRSLWG